MPATPAKPAKRPVDNGFGWSLGLRVRDDADAHRQCLTGLPFSAFTAFEKASRFPRKDILAAVEIPASTLSRRKATHFDSTESASLLRLAVLFEKATDLFEGDEDAARRWLRDKRAALGGFTPLELARTEFGTRMVLDLIGQLEHGVFP